jgi:hypothetical protein
MKMKDITSRALALLAMFSLVSCSSGLERYTAKYKQAKPHKAMALGFYSTQGYNSNGAWVGSWSSEQASLEKAKEMAIKDCEEYSLTHGGYVKCRITYENDNFIPSESSKGH